MNTTLLEAYKALPYGENFIAWLEEKHILEAFINRVEERTNREGRSLEHYPERCKGDVPADYITLSLYFCRCAEGEEFWKGIHNEWVEVCKANNYKRIHFTFDMYMLSKQQVSFDAFTLEEAERMFADHARRNASLRIVAHELVNSEHVDY